MACATSAPSLSTRAADAKTKQKSGFQVCPASNTDMPGMHSLKKTYVRPVSPVCLVHNVPNALPMQDGVEIVRPNAHIHDVKFGLVRHIWSTRIRWRVVWPRWRRRAGPRHCPVAPTWIFPTALRCPAVFEMAAQHAGCIACTWVLRWRCEAGAAAVVPAPRSGCARRHVGVEHVVHIAAAHAAREIAIIKVAGREGVCRQE